jgi:tetratricopeptide (TPR) repeat protein
MLYASLGPTSAELTRGQETLAATLVDLRRFAEAEAVFDSILAIDSAVIGIESQRYATHLGALGEARMLQGDFAAAFAIQQRALATMEAAVPGGSPRLVVARLRAGEAARRAGALERAESLLQNALARTAANPGDFPLERSEIQTDLALTLLERGDAAEALRLATTAADVLTGVLGPDHWRTARARAVRGLCLVHAGEGEGEREIRAGLDRLEAVRSAGDLHRGDAVRWLETGRVRDPDGD